MMDEGEHGQNTRSGCWPTNESAMNSGGMPRTMGGGAGNAGGGGSGAAAAGGEIDFKALAMESESLLSHIARPDGIPRLTKSLAEIVSS